MANNPTREDVLPVERKLFLLLLASEQEGPLRLSAVEVLAQEAR